LSSPFIQYIANEQHYTEVISRIASVRETLWIGTADIKDLYVKQGADTIPMLGQIAGLLKRGVGVRLIHAKEPGPNFREDFDKYPILATDLERVLCPRVHFKMIIFDLEMAYIGSANLTGAGIGMKSALRRNFEAGILTNDPEIVESAINQFDTLWIGTHCAKCGRKDFCGDRIK
jgi:phosphatidylserine/phosphatidylglycerophosphate/cardiolipin synthase-like enzyme